MSHMQKVLSTVILTLIIGAMAYWFYAQQQLIASLKQNKNVLTNKLNQSAIREQKLLTEIDPFQNQPFYQNKNISCQNWFDAPPIWKMYTNNEYRFTFTFPGMGIQAKDNRAVECSIAQVSYPFKSINAALGNSYSDEKLRLIYIPYIISIYESGDSTSIYNEIKESPFPSPIISYPQVGADEAYMTKYNNSFYDAKFKKGKTIIYITRIQNSFSNYDCYPINEYDFDKCKTPTSAGSFCDIPEKTREELSVYKNWDITKSIRFF